MFFRLICFFPLSLASYKYIVRSYDDMTQGRIQLILSTFLNRAITQYTCVSVSPYQHPEERSRRWRECDCSTIWISTRVDEENAELFPLSGDSDIVVTTGADSGVGCDSVQKWCQATISAIPSAPDDDPATRGAMSE